jgi:hypothetical protein
MPGLLDIAPSSRTVKIGDVDVGVHGVSAKGIAVLLERFPQVREMFVGRSQELTPDSIVTLIPDAIAAIIAAGTGSPGDPQAEAAAERLPVGVQADLLEAIIAVTMPKGVGPFLDQVMGVIGLVDAGPISTAVGKSPSPSSH